MTAFGLEPRLLRQRSGNVGPAMQGLMLGLSCCMLLATLIYFAGTEPIFQVQSVQFTAPDLVVLVSAIAAITWSFWNGFYTPPRVIVIPFALYWLATLLSALAADDKLRPAAALIQILELGVFAWCVSLLSSYKGALRLVHLIIGTFIFETLLAGWQFLTTAEEINAGDQARLYPHGSFSNQMKYCEFCAVLAVVSYALLISARRRSARVAYLTSTLLLLLGAIMGQERGPLVAFVISGVVITFLAGRGKNRRALMMKFGAGILAVVFLVASIPSLRDQVVSRIAEAQFQEVQRNTLLSRLMIWGYAWRTFQSHPMLGIGAKNFMLLSPELMDVGETGGVENADPHNVWLETLCEGGIVGLLTYIPLCLGVLALAYRRLDDPDWIDVQPFLLAFLSYHIFMMTLSNNYFVKAEGHMHFLMIGLMLGVMRSKAAGGEIRVPA
jgi:O-antigen ligase